MNWWTQPAVVVSNTGIIFLVGSFLIEKFIKAKYGRNVSGSLETADFLAEKAFDTVLKNEPKVRYLFDKGKYYGIEVKDPTPKSPITKTWLEEKFTNLASLNYDTQNRITKIEEQIIYYHPKANDDVQMVDNEVAKNEAPKEYNRPNRPLQRERQANRETAAQS